MSSDLAWALDKAEQKYWEKYWEKSGKCYNQLYSDIVRWSGIVYFNGKGSPYLSSLLMIPLCLYWNDVMFQGMMILCRYKNGRT